MADPAIACLLTSVKKLPSLPAIYLRLMQALESPDTSIEEIGRIIAQDMVMTARILQLVNSAYFGLQSNLTNPAEAITYLGINQTKALVLVAHVFSNFEETKTSFFSFDSLWRHSIATGKLAGWITRDETGNCKLAEESFTAGVLHDVGKLMLAVNLPDEYTTVAEEARQKRITFDVAERQILGTTHAELGACILGGWGLPFDLVQAIAFHHTPVLHDSKSFSSVTAVHLANVLEHEVQAKEEEAFRPKFDLDYLARLHLEHLPKVWREIVGSTAK
jgi:HD-like signal output (HDOD) protein